VGPQLRRRLLAEFLGTGFLVAAVVGSGIAAARLSPHDTGLQLFENAAATAAALIAIILAVGPVSGAHLNPVVTLADRVFGGLSNRDAGGYIAAQLTGGAAGSVVANVMFSLPAFELSTKVRSGHGLWLGEVVATLGLLVVIFGVVRSGRGSVAPFAVGAYIGGAYFFTSSTSFANPAVTVARMLSNTFAGIAPSSAPAFIVAQLLGGAVAVGVIRVLYPSVAEVAADLIVPHAEDSGDPEAPVDGPDERILGSVRALPKIRGLDMSDTPEVLFVCVHNAGRSQMAAALLDHHAQGRVRVTSAGSEPASELNQAVVAAMEEIGLDLSKAVPKPLTGDVAEASDVIVTMGCGDACPVYLGKRYLDWDLPDPAGKSLEEIRPIRDEIDRRVRGLTAELVARP
jgi:arsenate reductase